MALPIKTGQMFIGLAVIMGLLTVGVMSGTGKKSRPKTENIETQMIVVPKVPISEGKMITLEDVETVAWPKDFLPKDSAFTSAGQVQGRVAKQDLFPGEPIFKQKVSGSDTHGGLPALIPEGYRAVTVAVTEVKGVAGFVKPGDRVDVLTTFELEDEDGENVRVTRTVLQNVLVLASAQTMVNEDRYGNMETPPGVIRGEAGKTEEEPQDKRNKKKKDKEKEKSAKELEKERKAREKEKLEAEKRARLVSSVTLAVSPEQSQILALAEESGDIRLALRPELDHKLYQVSNYDSKQILGLPPVSLGVAKKSTRNDGPPPASMASAPPPPPMPGGPAMVRYGTSVELIEGTQKTNLDF